MPKIVTLFPDSNFFLQCKTLDQLDWTSWQAFDEVHLILSRPTQTEIDGHKQKGNDRRAKRARTAATLFRDIIVGKKAFHEVRVANPAVRFFIRLDIQPDPDSSERLDYDHADDQLAGIAHAFLKQMPGSDVRVLTDDTGVMASAAAIGIGIAEFPDNWRLPPESSESDKKIKALEKRIAELEENEPRLTIESLNPEGKSIERLEFTMQKYEALTLREISGFMTTLRTRFPLQSEFGSRERQEKETNAFPGFSLGSKQVFTPATDREIQTYQHAYDAWLAKCESILGNLHTELEIKAGPLPFEFSATNIGSMPATDVLVTLTAQGNFMLAPPPEPDNKREGETEEEGKEERDDGLKLPAAPQAPQGSWRNVSSIDRFLGISGLTDQLGIAHAVPAWPTDMVKPYFPTDFARDPNTFYFKPRRPSEPVTRFGFECKQWRHGGQPEPFCGEIRLEDQMSEASGIITCEISAGNISKSVTSMVKVSIKTIGVSASDAAACMVDALIA